MDKRIIPVIATAGLTVLLLGLAMRKDNPELSNALLIIFGGGASFTSLMIALGRLE